MCSFVHSQWGVVRKSIWKEGVLLSANHFELTLSWRKPLSYRNQSIDRPLIGGANQWTGFYMITASITNELIKFNKEYIYNQNIPHASCLCEICENAIFFIKVWIILFLKNWTCRQTPILFINFHGTLTVQIVWILNACNANSLRKLLKVEPLKQAISLSKNENKCIAGRKKYP